VSPALSDDEEGKSGVGPTFMGSTGFPVGVAGSSRAARLGAGDNVTAEEVAPRTSMKPTQFHTGR
jgi:hypothetical protein